MTKLKLTSIETSAGSVIPKETLARLKVGVDDTLAPDLALKINKAAEIMRRFSNTLRALAR